MLSQKLARSILALIAINCLIGAVAVAAKAQQHEDKRELRAKLLKQVRTDFKDDCMESDENITIEAVDLNRDGVDEYEVEMSGACTCGEADCSLLVYRQAGQGFELILEDGFGFGIEALKTSTNGYRDLLITARANVEAETKITYKFDGRQYRESKKMVVHVETGESKPAWRRLQFRRGTSETTVQGKVSIALRDIYLVRGRAGQVMTLKLTAAPNAVRIRVMSQSTTSLLADNARHWTGVLPESGDYHIIVDAEERASVYSMTVSIK